MAGIPLPRPAKKAPRRGSGRAAGDRLANSVLAHLPLAVAVFDADSRLFFWNNQAACLFGVPPLMAEAHPALADILTGMRNSTTVQRDRIVAFAEDHIAAGDKTEPDSCLRLSLGRDHRLVLQVYGLGVGRWMLVVDEGRMHATASPAGGHPGDAWLDALTGLSNRRHFNQTLQAAPPDASHAVLLIDLDRFAEINETLGHPVGDALLCLVAQRLRRELRDDDLLARPGGDEFAILIANGDAAEALAARVVDILSRPFRVEGHLVTIGASIGIARVSPDGKAGDDLMRQADLALYEAKTSGRGVWRLFEPGPTTLAEQGRELETDLRRALTGGEMSIAYRAQVNLETGLLIGFEASPHWNHPTRGLLPPTIFVPIAEATGCIVALDEWMLQAACAEAARWPSPLTVTVPLSRRACVNGDPLLASVQAALERSGLPPERLALAIAEASIEAREAHVHETLHRLRSAGVRIALAGFKAGSSSLPRSQSFPFSKTRIKCSDIHGLTEGDDGAAVVALEPTSTVVNQSLGVNGYLNNQLLQASEIGALLRRYAPALEKVSVAG